MLRKLFIGILVIVIAIILLFVLKDSYKDALTNDNSDKNSATTIKQEIDGTDIDGFYFDYLNNEDYEDLILDILDRPIVFREGLSEGDRQQYTETIENLNNLIRENNDNLAAWYDLGSYKKATGDIDGALEVWNFLTLARPDSFVAYHNIGITQGFDLKNCEKAEEYLLKAIDKNSTNIDTYVQLSTIYQYTCNSLEKTKGILELGIKNNPTNSNLNVLLGNLYLKEDDSNAALNYFEKALELNPENEALKQEIENLKSY